MEPFRFALTDAEKDYLKSLARWAINQGLENGPWAGDMPQLPEPPTDKLRQSYGAFVTLHEPKSRGGRLRGCIGHIVGDQPLFRTIASMAQAAAFQDPRFPPLSRAQAGDVELEISVLSPLTPCPDLNQVEVGRHGLLVRRGNRSGLLLPQVPVEWGWDRQTFLKQTCIKAGLPGACWQDPQAQWLWFEAEVF